MASLLPELTSTQLFGEMKRLSQAGQVRVVLDGRGIGTVRCANQRVRHWDATKEEHPNGTAQLDYPPLTLTELSELLLRHADNAAIAKVSKNAIQRRLAETGSPSPNT